MILGAGSGPLDDNQLSGQARHHVATTQSQSDSYKYDGDSRKVDYDSVPWHEDRSDENNDVDSAVGEVTLVLQKAEKDALNEESSLLNQAISAGGKALRAGIAKILGAGASSQEVEMIAKDVEKTVLSESINRLHEEADEAVASEIEEVTLMVDEGAESGMDGAWIRNSVKDKTDYYSNDIRLRISDIENELETGLHDLTLEVEKKLLEEKLSKAAGREIHLAIVEGELTEKEVGSGGGLRGKRKKKKNGKRKKKKQQQSSTISVTNNYGGGTVSAPGYGETPNNKGNANGGLSEAFGGGYGGTLYSHGAYGTTSGMSTNSFGGVTSTYDRATDVGDNRAGDSDSDSEDESDSDSEKSSLISSEEKSDDGSEDYDGDDSVDGTAGNDDDHAQVRQEVTVSIFLHQAYERLHGLPG